MFRVTLRIVCDSVADLPPEVLKELGITTIPLLVRFGDEVYRDAVDLSVSEFYQKLMNSRVLPVTSVPPPVAFAETYDRLAGEADEILVITLSSRLSGTYSVALQSIGLMKKPCRVVVVDSQVAALAEGFVVVKAAQVAKAGASLDEAVKVVKETIPRVHFRATLSTLEYLQRGGRIGKAQAFLGSILKVNPIITLKDGVVEPVTRTYSRTQAIEHIYNFVLSFQEVEALAVEHSGDSSDADRLARRLGSVFPNRPIYRSGATPVIGAHTGPGLLLVAVMGERKPGISW
ncbi:MAG: DegV family protein [Chloroflexota bacterium]